MKLNSFAFQALVFILSLFSFFNCGYGQRTLRDELLGVLVKVDEYKIYDVVKLERYFNVQNNMFNIQTAIFQSYSYLDILEPQSVTLNPINVIFPPVDIYTWIKIIKNENNIYPRNKFPEKILYGEDPSCKNTISYKCYKACLICSGQYFVTQNKITYNVGKEEEFKLDNGSTFYGYKLGSLNTSFQDTQIKIYFELLKCNYPNISQLIKTMNSINLQDDNRFNNRCTCNGIRFCSKCDNLNNDCETCFPYAYQFEGKCLDIIPNCEIYHKDWNQPQGCTQCMKGYIKIGEECVARNTCPDGQYLQGNICCKLGYGSVEGRTCSECNENCIRCSSILLTTPQDCHECIPQYIPYKGYGQCRTCGEGLFYDDKQCKKCTMKKCKSCKSADPQDCQVCIDGFVLTTGLDGKKYCTFCTENMNCPTTNRCEQWEFRSQEDPYDCQSCGAGCYKCFNKNTCQECFSGFVLHSGICKKVEAKSQYLDPSTKKQKSCNFACSKCSDNTNLCDSCSPNFSYYIEKNGKKVCFQKCPLYFSPSANNPKLCELQSNLSTELQNIAKAQIDFQRSDMLKNIWENRQICPPKCEQCTSSGCIQCTQGYFWDNTQKECLKCHASCISCNGESFFDCTSCTSFSMFLPFGYYGLCTKPSSYQDYVQYKKCSFYKTYQGYQVTLNQVFRINQPWWRYFQINKNCDFDQFKQLYPFFKNTNYTCKNEEMSKEEDYYLIFLLATILSSEQLKIQDANVNPENLIDKAIKDMALTTKYLFTPRQTFNCYQLSCQYSINLAKLKLELDSNTNLRINKYKEIIFKYNGEPLICDPSVEDKKLEDKYVLEFEDLVRFSYSSSPDTKLYYIFNVCGAIKPQYLQKVEKPFVLPVLVSKQLGQGYYEYIETDSIAVDGAYIISTFGASQKQNEILQDCYPNYQTPYAYYKVMSIQVYEVSKQGRYKSAHESQLSKIKFQLENQSAINNTSTKCICGRAHDFIILNDRRGGLFDQNDNSDNILTPYIKKKDMLQVLSSLGVKDIQISKFPTFTQQKLFEMYIDNLILNVKKCYPIEKFTQCVQNVLIDIAYSSFGNCLKDSDTENAVKQQQPITQLQTAIQKSQWCLNNKFRCQKHMETLYQCT